MHSIELLSINCLNICAPLMFMHILNTDTHTHTQKPPPCFSVAHQRPHGPMSCRVKAQSLYVNHYISVFYYYVSHLLDLWHYTLHLLNSWLIHDSRRKQQPAVQWLQNIWAFMKLHNLSLSLLLPCFFLSICLHNGALRMGTSPEKMSCQQIHQKPALSDSPPLSTLVRTT